MASALQPLTNLSQLQQRRLPQPLHQQQNTFFLINTLYLYSRDTNRVLRSNPHDMSKFINMDCIFSLYNIFEKAQKKSLFKGVNSENQQEVMPDLPRHFKNDDQYMGSFSGVFTRFLSSFARVGANLFPGRHFQTTINSWTLYEQQNLIQHTDQNPNELFITPEDLFTKVHNTNPSELQNQVFITFDYVMFLFSISLAVNHKFDWTDDKSNIANLYRHNAMIISFLSIFTSYFKPLLDYLQQQNPDIYNNIITFINEIIKIHNVGSADELLDENSTYNRNLEKNEEKSKAIKEELQLDNSTAELSYEILKEYNTQIFAENNINFKALYDNSIENKLDGEVLDFSNANSNPNEIVIPMLPNDARSQPVLSKKMGLSQPEINSLLMDLVPDMCSSDLQLTSLKNQFTVGGIPFSTKYPALKNYLGFIREELVGGKTVEYEILTGQPDWNTKTYFQYLMTAYADAVSKFYILTAINSHNDIIYLTKVGSFDCHIPTETITKNVISCNKEFAILIGAHVQGKIGIKDLQQAHRSMIIVDLRPTKQKTPEHAKVYYFEPFGQFYPVYDILGRLIPHMPEIVIAKRFKEALPEAPTKEFSMMLPLFEHLFDNGTGIIQACNTSIFQVVNTNYLGASKAFMGDAINKVINSVSVGRKHKTLDWTTGYCGLVVLFMTVLVRMNCMMGMKGAVDDILLWFNTFNLNPLYTYNNLLPRFLVRGFAQLVEQLLAGKVKVIESQKINIDLIMNEFSDNIMEQPQHQFTGYDIKKTKTRGDEYTKEATDELYKLLGLQPNENITGNAEQQKKVRDRLNSVIVYLFNIIDNYDRIEDKPTVIDDANQELSIDEKLYKKLVKHRRVILTKKDKNYASMDVARVFGLSITNRFRKLFGSRDKIKILDEPSLAIFSGRDGSFNSEFPRIIFVDVTLPSF